MVNLEEQYCSLEELPTDPKHPFFYHVYSHTLPREEQYRIIPDDKDIVVNSLESIKQKNYRRRVIFSGWNNYTLFEKEQIELVKK